MAKKSGDAPDPDQVASVAVAGQASESQIIHSRCIYLPFKFGPVFHHAFPGTVLYIHCFMSPAAMSPSHSQSIQQAHAKAPAAASN